MTDEEKTERLARVLWLAHWDGQPPYEWDDEPGRATDWRNTAAAALTWLDSSEDGPAVLRAERDALRAEVERLQAKVTELAMDRLIADSADLIVDDLRPAIPLHQQPAELRDVLRTARQPSEASDD